MEINLRHRKTFLNYLLHLHWVNVIDTLPSRNIKKKSKKSVDRQVFFISHEIR